MHPLLSAFIQANTTTTTKSSHSSSSSYFFLILIVIFAAVYFLFLRPRQQRMRQQQTQAKQVSVGDEVMSAGGIYGTVVGIGDDQIDVEVADGVIMSFTKRAISLRQQPNQAPPANPFRRGATRPAPQPAEPDYDEQSDYDHEPESGNYEDEGGHGDDGPSGPAQSGG